MSPKTYLTKSVKTKVIAEHMRELARKRAATLTPEQRKAIATKASRAAAEARRRKAAQRRKEGGIGLPDV